MVLVLGLVGGLMSSRGVQASSLDSCPEIIQAYFGEAHSEAACRVSYCESRWNPDAVSPGGHVGYFQISPIHGWHASTDPETNVAFAYELSKGGTDWSQWACRA